MPKGVRLPRDPGYSETCLGQPPAFNTVYNADRSQPSWLVAAQLRAKLTAFNDQLL